MPSTGKKILNAHRTLTKAPTGISGLDEITGGGLPKGRTTLITGGAGCGKTLMGMEFLIRGVRDYGEPGLFVSFEESEQELMQNVASLGFDVANLVKRKLLAIDMVRAERSEIEETGDYDLEGLFVRLDHAISQIKAQRVVLDTIEALFVALPNHAILRAELRRLFRWLKDRGVTAIVTAERGDGMLTRHGLEEYVSDCVILLDHRVIDQISTRRLRVVKYRGSSHGTNEYPFLIDDTGFSVMPITSMSLSHDAPTGRMSSGIPMLDQMLGGKGFYRGSSILVSGTPGSGKTSLAVHMADAACRRGDRCVYFPFEESQPQIIRNLRSIGFDLGQWVAQGLLRFYPARPHLRGLETHLAAMHKQIVESAPKLVVIDPVSNLTDIGTVSDAKAMLTRLVDFLKSRGITAVFTNLTSDNDDPEKTEVGISSLMDAWLLVRNLESNGERNRGFYILKSRGMAHSNQIREFVLTNHGAVLRDAYVGTSGVVTGTARLIQEERDQAEEQTRRNEIARKQRELEYKRVAMDAQIVALREAYAAEASELETLIAEGKKAEQAIERQRQVLIDLRDGGRTNSRGGPRKRSNNGHLNQRLGRGTGRQERTGLEAR